MNRIALQRLVEVDGQRFLAIEGRLDPNDLHQTWIVFGQQIVVGQHQVCQMHAGGQLVNTGARHIALEGDKAAGRGDGGDFDQVAVLQSEIGDIRKLGVLGTQIEIQHHFLAVGLNPLHLNLLKVGRGHYPTRQF